MHDFWTHAQPIRKCLIEQRVPTRPPTAKPQNGGIIDLITRSPIAAYRFKTGWELLDEHDYCPDEYLANLANCGINGIWVAGLFRTLIASTILPELGPAQHRLEKLIALVHKAGRHGVKVWLFCMEPRSVRSNHPILAAHPEIRGAKVDEGEYCLCTSTPLVQEYIRQATCELFKSVPQLGGLISIFNGERITNCWLSDEYARTCPRCSQRPQVDVLAEDIGCYLEGIERAGSYAKFLAWNYWMDPSDELKTQNVAPMLELIQKTRRDVVWLGNFEHGGHKTIAGKSVPIDEYSLSFVGPCEPFERIAKQATQVSSTVYAKLQIGTTFELSTVPYLPVPGIVFDKIQRLKKLGGGGAMLSWIPGGFPSIMLKAAGEAASWQGSKEAFLEHLAKLYFGSSVAVNMVRAWNAFERGLLEYPFTNRLFYFGPITRGPVYPLRLEAEPNRAEPYNWGIDRNRNPQPFEEEIERWIAPFTVDEVIHQLARMTAFWDEGLQQLKMALKTSPGDELARALAVAAAAGEHWRCASHVLQFITKRNAIRDLPPQPQAITELKQLVEAQIAAAKRMIDHITTEPTIGFQSELLAFVYDRLTLQDSIKINQQTLQTLNGPMDQIEAEIRKIRPMIPRTPDVFDVDNNGD
ncbi:MAG: hypothetical protein IT447_13020 [Phycisphaerales bacterium]|jgi:hypothetical protein|nr:hypothetical protein [Phycisphaerales bacterium]